MKSTGGSLPYSATREKASISLFPVSHQKRETMQFAATLNALIDQFVEHRIVKRVAPQTPQDVSRVVRDFQQDRIALALRALGERSLYDLAGQRHGNSSVAVSRSHVGQLPRDFASSRGNKQRARFSADCNDPLSKREMEHRRSFENR